jgi:hypothetical protein
MRIRLRGAYIPHELRRVFAFGNSFQHSPRFFFSRMLCALSAISLSSMYILSYPRGFCYETRKKKQGPHCLNRGGNLAQCGILFGKHDENGKLVPWERNYDKPLNVRKLPMSPNVQAEYDEGDVIEIEAMITTHHKGHMEFSVCPIGNSVPMEVPTARCFAKNKLEFVSDELYGAPVDTKYPERAYMAPASKANWGQGSNLYAASYRLKFRLPMGVSGDLVLLQWYYLTANSCKHDGYADYPFPDEWGSDTKL